MRAGVRLSLLVLSCLLLLATTPDTEQPLSGYSAASSRTERDWEGKFRAIPEPQNQRDYMQRLAARPHHVGSPYDKDNAEWMLAKFKEWGLDASIESFDVLFPTPKARALELVEPIKFIAKLQEPALAVDPTSNQQAEQLPTYNAYSGDGDVTAPLVYVNYGIPDDYEKLERLGVSVKGAIVIARYGNSWRGIKPKVAAEHGAVGCLTYSDPADDGYVQGDVFPAGGWRPRDGVQRGSVMDMPVYPGDPLTPGVGATKDAKRLDLKDVKTITKIPVLPISYADAQPLLAALKGDVVPDGWRGSLPQTYHLGPGPAKVHLKVQSNWDIKALYDVIVKIPGSNNPDEWIVRGNHHDAWVNGAADPTSGNVALMETARGLGELLKTGWRPRRTIILASWDGEEWGLLGSTEWVEKHAQELSTKAVAYVNSDSTSKGWFDVSGSHSLQAFVNDLMRDLQDPKRAGKTLFQAKLDRAVSQAKTDDEKSKLERRGDFPIEALGSGSDYTAFLDHLTIASLNMGFGGEAPDSGVYHSTYDSFYWYTHFSDTDFAYGAMLSKTIGTAILRLANADVLPFEFSATARTLRGYADELDKLRRDTKGAPALEMAAVSSAIDRLAKAADAYNRASAQRLGSGAPLDRAKQAELNRLLYTSERAFKYDAGLPKREWFKHLAYAPGFYTGYGVKTLPGIREGIEQHAWDEPKKYIPIVATAIDKLAAQIERARSLIANP